MAKAGFPDIRLSRRATLRALAAGAGAVSVASRASRAEEYPDKPIRLVVPLSPGGSGDVLGRIVADALTHRLGQTVVVENKPGAAATIGANYAAKARPDGYTLFFSPPDSASVAAAVRPKLPYRIPEDFAFIARIASSPEVMTVNAKLPIHNLKELIAYAKANPGKLRYGSVGVGSSNHLLTVWFANAVGIEMVHVPYDGGGAATTALLGGFIDLFVAIPLAMKSYLDSGALRALATTGATRTAVLPDVPTLVESGLPDFVVTIWFGVMAPADTPEPVQATLRKATADIMQEPSVVARIRQIGQDPDYLAGDAFRSFVVKETALWKAVAEKAGIKQES